MEKGKKIMDSLLELLGRYEELFTADIVAREADLSLIVADARFLVIGGGSTIGQSVVRELFRRKPRLLHVVDANQHSLVELVRDLRSSLGYIEGGFATYAIDPGSYVFDAFMASGQGYDFVLNLAELNHVRSEKDPYTLMRMVDMNVFNAEKAMRQSLKQGARKYFSISGEKAVNPASIMGASKRMMELYLLRRSQELPVSIARVANVAFSEGSLLYGFDRRLEKDQPIAVPGDVHRYFMTPKEAGELCLVSCLLGENRDIHFPKFDQKHHSITFNEVVMRFLRRQGYEAIPCTSENEARSRVAELKARHQWPVYYTTCDTSGEKGKAEFHTECDALELDRFATIGIIKNEPVYAAARLDAFEHGIRDLQTRGNWDRGDFIDLFNDTLLDFQHQETGLFLDGRM